jgi:hypothetical protein
MHYLGKSPEEWEVILNIIEEHGPEAALNTVEVGSIGAEGVLSYLENHHPDIAPFWKEWMVTRVSSKLFEKLSGEDARASDIQAWLRQRDPDNFGKDPDPDRTATITVNLVPHGQAPQLEEG